MAEFDVSEYMPTQPVLRPYVPAYPRLAKVTRWLSTVTWNSLLFGAVVAFLGAAVALGMSR